MKSSQGFTLPEAMAVIAVTGILAAFAIPQFGFTNRPLQNGTYQLAGVFKQARMRAIATTSATRIYAESPTQLVVETSRSASCSAQARLTEAATSDTKELKVNTLAGFNVGQKLRVGTSTQNNGVLGVTSDPPTLILGQPLGSSQPQDAVVEPLDEWRPERSFTDNLNFPASVALAETNWLLCFDSRGLANSYNLTTRETLTGNLNLTLTDAKTKSKSGIEVFQGGALKIDL
ncbi:prepilin-type N-terminal cleavage/methylation domain-containing protein [Synechococcales cyanobacterium C]|uniref:Prepilin-type N-terminal cleavage/methylation domain-containing protein n=1 Tax=Petrachloros mirabilis ULC683 TaxID=2781853 RepID=A0A8K2A7T7_9CYAN|nr:prepilin-type N-terminal cleavage/methylation domain-containing protein [Petrachloros mirabilis]NCJ06534.1 prepilin-type N-terminal cleavage/methylation domain-containing protein [Petrachloros mirabilis ULC683]